MKTTCAIYTRVSTAGQNPENQKNELLRFAKSQKWEVCKSYEDIASGSASDRKSFKEMMAAASKKKFDIILFWSLDRFSREGTATTLQYLQQLDSWGVGFRSYTESYLDSLGLFKDVVLALLATLAKQERIRISERTRAGLAVARKKGKKLGRPGLDASLRSEIRVLRKKGLSYGEISKKLGIGRTSVHRHIKRH